MVLLYIVSEFQENVLCNFLLFMKVRLGYVSKVHSIRMIGIVCCLFGLIVYSQ